MRNKKPELPLHENFLKRFTGWAEETGNIRGALVVGSFARTDHHAARIRIPQSDGGLLFSHGLDGQAPPPRGVVAGKILLRRLFEKPALPDAGMARAVREKTGNGHLDGRTVPA